MQKINLQKNRGYTIIETMIAVSLFLVIVMVGMGSLLNATLLQKKSQNMRSIMDSLSFIMEDISRNARTGYTYHCSDSLFNLATVQDCSSDGSVIAFESASGDPLLNNDQWVYKIDSSDGGSTFNISKSINSGTSWTQLNSSEINFKLGSGFLVTGSSLGDIDNKQPFIIIKLVGEITSENNIITPFSLQTSVSQRLVDITLP